MAFFYAEKVVPPELQQGLLHPRVFEKLPGCAESVFCISAPAGFGKSVLARQLADQICVGEDCPLLWYKVESVDRDPAVFFNVLKQAVCNDRPGALISVPDISSEELLHLDAFVPRFFSAVLETYGSSLVLVLDNFEQLSDNAPLHSILANALITMSDQMTVIVASRNTPPASWERLTVEGRLRRFSQADLTLSVDAVEKLLDGTAWTGNEKVAQQLLEKSGGWIAGVKLLIDHAVSASTIDLITPEPNGDRTAMFRYFAAEVFAQLDSETQAVLLKTSMLPFVPESITAELCELGDAAACLDTLHHRQFFLTRYRAEGQRGFIYVYHDLLREFLTEAFAQYADQAERGRLIRNAAVAFQANGWLEEAVTLFANAGDWAACADYLELHAAELFAQGRAASLLSLFEQLPSDRRESVPALQFWYGLCLCNTDLAAAREQLQKAYDGYKSVNNLAGMTSAWAAVADVLWIEWKDSFLFDDWIDELAEIRLLLGEQHQNLLPTLAKGAFVAMINRCMDHPDLPYWEKLNLDYLEQGLSTHDALMRSLQMMQHYTWGTADCAKATLVSRYLDCVMDRQHCSVMFKCIHAVCAGAYKFWFSPAALDSLDTIGRGLEIADQQNWHVCDIPLLNVALFSVCATGETDRILPYLEQLKQRLDSDSRPNDLAVYYYFQAYLDWLDGRYPQALVSAEKALNIAENGGFSFTPPYYQLAVARILASLGRGREARAAISRVRKTGSGFRSYGIVYIAHTVGADIAYEQGQIKRALHYFKQAIAIGRTQRYYSKVWVDRPNFVELCKLALADEPDCEYLAERIGNLRRDNAFDPPRVNLLGRCQVQKPGSDGIPVGKLAKVPMTLLLHLVCADYETGLENEEVMHLMWPDVPQKKAYANLKTNVRRLRATFADELAIEFGSGRIRLNLSRSQVDCWQIEDMADDLPVIDPGEMESVFELYRGELYDRLTDAHDVGIYKARLHNCFCVLVRTIAKHYRQSGSLQALLETHEKALQRDPYNEEFVQGKMVALVLLDRQPELYDYFDAQRKAWQREFGEDLSRETRDAFRQALNGNISELA